MSTRITRPLHELARGRRRGRARAITRRRVDRRVDPMRSAGSAAPSTPCPRVRELGESSSARGHRAPASEAHYRTIVEVALDCIITIDAAGKVVEFNPAAEKTFGYQKHDVVGRELAELIVPPAHREAHRKGLARYIATGDRHV